jgi:hypothetical protein
MTKPRRHLIRPSTSSSKLDSQRQQRIFKLRIPLDSEQQVLVQTMTKVTRNFRGIQMCLTSTARAEQLISYLEYP